MDPYYYFVGCYGIPSHEICDGWLCARCKRNAWTAVSGLFIPSIVGPFKSSGTCTFVCSSTVPCFSSLLFPNHPTEYLCIHCRNVKYISRHHSLPRNLQRLAVYYSMSKILLHVLSQLGFAVLEIKYSEWQWRWESLGPLRKPWSFTTIPVAWTLPCLFIYTFILEQILKCLC